MIDLYHWRAFRYRETLWRSHLDGVEAFLRSWQAPPNLVIIGASGGYSLPLDWLSRFREITVVEPGPLARAILRLRLSSRPLEVRYVAQALDFEKPGFLRPFEAPETGYLFANVLGQVRVTHPASWASVLCRELRGKSWASFHDRFSADRILWKTPPGPQATALSTESLVATPESSARELKLQEHLVSDALRACIPAQVRYWNWRIAPRQVHLIEGMWVSDQSLF